MHQLEQILKDHLPSLSVEIQGRILAFYEILVRENEVQNLTRLISPQDFYYGHLLDVLELLKTGWLENSNLDIGSGCGVPGLLAALIEPRQWVLCESEKRKAEYLIKAAHDLGVGERVQVIPERVEKYLKGNKAGLLTARAVGTVEKIYSFIFKCSSWNKLILFKGPSWESEWKAFQESKFKNSMKINCTHQYSTGERQKVLVELVRA